MGDLRQRGIGARIILLKVPRAWGRSAVLDHVAEAVSSDDSPVTLIVRINGREMLRDGAGVQAQVLRGLLTDAGDSHRVASLLGLDRLAGGVQLGLGVGALFVSGIAGALAYLVGGLAVGAAGKMWDNSPAGQSGAMAIAARSVAGVSARVPVAVLIDDADYLDLNLAIALLENLVFRRDGQLLAVVVVDPGSALTVALAAGDRPRLADVVHAAEADPDMSYASSLGWHVNYVRRYPMR